MKVKNIRFVSIEPIHENIGFHFSRKDIDWIIVGAETGNRKDKVEPKKEWINSIIENARDKEIPLFIKDNVHWHEKIREFPIKVSSLTREDLLKKSGTPRIEHLRKEK